MVEATVRQRSLAELAGLRPPLTPPLCDHIRRTPRLRRRQVVYLRQHVGEPQGQCGQISHMGASVVLLGEPVTEHLEGGEAVTAPCDVC